MNDMRKLIETIEQINEVSDFDSDALDALIVNFEDICISLRIETNPVKQKELTQVILSRAFRGPDFMRNLNQKKI